MDKKIVILNDHCFDIAVDVIKKNMMVDTIDFPDVFNYGELNYNENKPIISFNIDKAMEYVLGYPAACSLKSAEELKYASINLANRFFLELKNKSYDRAIVFNGYSPLPRSVFLEVTRSMNIRTFVYERGILPKNTFSDAGGTLQIDNGWAKDSYLFKDGIFDSIVNNKEYLDLGKEYLLNYVNNKRSTSPKNINYIGSNTVKERLGLNKYDKIVFVPMQIDRDIQLIVFSDVVKSNNALFELLNKNMPDNYAVVFKKHPEDMLKSFDVIKKKNSRNNFYFVEDIHIHSLIEMADYICCINSGVGLESILFNKKVVVFGRSIYEKFVCKVNDVNEFNMKCFEYEYDYDKIYNFLGFLVREYLFYLEDVEFLKRKLLSDNWK